MQEVWDELPKINRFLMRLRTMEKWAGFAVKLVNQPRRGNVAHRRTLVSIQTGDRIRPTCAANHKMPAKQAKPVEVVQSIANNPAKQMCKRRVICKYLWHCFVEKDAARRQAAHPPFEIAGWHVSCISLLWCPRPELNRRLSLRSALFYPLNYGGLG